MTDSKNPLPGSPDPEAQMITVLRSCGFDVRVQHRAAPGVCPDIFGTIDNATALFKLAIAGADCTRLDAATDTCAAAALTEMYVPTALSADALDKIARSYFAEEYGQNQVKQAIHDALIASRPASVEAVRMDGYEAGYLAAMDQVDAECAASVPTEAALPVAYLHESPNKYRSSVSRRATIFDDPHDPNASKGFEGWTVTPLYAAPFPTAGVQGETFTYSSTQATNCAGCGKHKHTPLRIDAMGGYVCLTCIDQKLGGLLGEFGHAQPDSGRDAALRTALEGLLNHVTDPAGLTVDIASDLEKFSEFFDGLDKKRANAISVARAALCDDPAENGGAQ